MSKARAIAKALLHAAAGGNMRALSNRIEVNTLAKLAVKTLGLNKVGVCNVSVARPIVFDSYADNRDTGAFILIDRYSNETVAAGICQLDQMAL